MTQRLHDVIFADTMWLNETNEYWQIKAVDSVYVCRFHEMLKEPIFVVISPCFHLSFCKQTKYGTIEY